jgi:hypothetical protein
LRAARQHYGRHAEGGREAASSVALRRFVGSGGIAAATRALRGSTEAGGVSAGVGGATPNGGPALAGAWRRRQWLAGSGRRGAARNRAGGRRAGAVEAHGEKVGEKRLRWADRWGRAALRVTGKRATQVGLAGLAR